MKSQKYLAFLKKVYIHNLNKEAVRLQKIIDEKVRQRKPYNENTSRMDYSGIIEPESSQLDIINMKIRKVCDFTLGEMSPYGGTLPIKQFIEDVRQGGFIDYDGYGKYSKDGKMSNIVINPSDIKAGIYRKDFSHVRWFNR